MARDLTDDEKEILGRLHQKLQGVRLRNTQRSLYFDGEKRLDHLPSDIPVSRGRLAVPVGWPQKAVTKFASRLRPQFYSSTRETTILDDVRNTFADNHMEFLEGMAIQAAAQHGPSFFFTSAGGPGEPEVLITLRDAHSATALLDPRTRRVTAALEVADDDAQILYLPHMILHLRRDASAWRVVEDQVNPAGRVLCSPYVHGASIARPLGTSRITRPLMALTDAGVTTLLRQDVAAGFYMVPRGFVIDAFEEQFDERRAGGRTGWDSMVGAWSALASQFDEETGEIVKPEVKTLPQMTMQPFSDQFRLIAAQVAGETSIPLSYLGVVQDSNPTSAEAIHAQESDLVREVRGQQASFNLGRKSLAIDVLTALYGDISEDEAALADLRRITPRWEDPRTRSVSEQSQFVALQVQAGNFQPGTESTLMQLPIDPEDARRMAEENRETIGEPMIERLLEMNARADPEAVTLATTE